MCCRNVRWRLMHEIVSLELRTEHMHCVRNVCFCPLDWWVTDLPRPTVHILIHWFSHWKQVELKTCWQCNGRTLVVGYPDTTLSQIASPRPSSLTATIRMTKTTALQRSPRFLLHVHTYCSRQHQWHPNVEPPHRQPIHQRRAHRHHRATPFSRVLHYTLHYNRCDAFTRSHTRVLDLFQTQKFIVIHKCK